MHVWLAFAQRGEQVLASCGRAVLLCTKAYRDFLQVKRNKEGGVNVLTCGSSQTFPFLAVRADSYLCKQVVQNVPDDDDDDTLFRGASTLSDHTILESDDR